MDQCLVGKRPGPLVGSLLLLPLVASECRAAGARQSIGAGVAFGVAVSPFRSFPLWVPKAALEYHASEVGHEN